VRDLGVQEYTPTWQRMKSFTDARSDDSEDEIWIVEHPPVFTLGQAGKEIHLLAPGDIPVVRTDRGGQVTYHGPGQLVAYVLLDIRRLGIGVRDLVTAVETAVVGLLAQYGVVGLPDKKAPGVYVGGEKVSALGLRIRRGRSYHGLSLNLDMDLSPFDRINPCGYEGLKVTSLAELGVDVNRDRIAQELADLLCDQFGYDASRLLRDS
jgi:lipoyl(octanoyl) transferase